MSGPKFKFYFVCPRDRSHAIIFNVRLTSAHGCSIIITKEMAWREGDKKYNVD